MLLYLKLDNIIIKSFEKGWAKTLEELRVLNLLCIELFGLSSMGNSDNSVNSEQRKESKEERLLRKAKAYVEREERRKRERKKRKREEHSEQKRKKRHAKKTHDYDDRYQDDEHIPGKKRSRRDGDEKRRRKKHKKKSKESTIERKNTKSRSDNLKTKIDIEKSKLSNLGSPRNRPPDQPLDPEKDYFAYHQHLWLYLHRREGVAFGDLSSSEARDAFRRFVKKYNAGKLEEAYYESVLPSEALENGLATRHQWNFHTNTMEKKNLNLIEEGVRKQTDYQKSEPGSIYIGKGDFEKGEKMVSEEKIDNTNKSNVRLGNGPEARRAEKIANRRLREHIKVAEEELSGGRKEGHERLVEKRREKATAIHGAARDREESTVGVELKDSDIYGGDVNDFAAALQRERQRKQHRDHRKNNRIKELEQKERDRQEAMLRSLGLSGIKPGQKITIRPRDD